MINGSWKMSRSSALIFALVGLGGGFSIYDQRSDVAVLKTEVRASRDAAAVSATWLNAKVDAAITQTQRDIADMKSSLRAISDKLDQKADKR